jgi:hypothetical protein
MYAVIMNNICPDRVADCHVLLSPLPAQLISPFNLASGSCAVSFKGSMTITKWLSSQHLKNASGCQVPWL